MVLQEDTLPSDSFLHRHPPEGGSELRSGEGHVIVASSKDINFEIPSGRYRVRPSQGRVAARGR